ncbi:MAG TPA: hypothetical protein PLK75_04990, partial [Bacteroidales bacterium]|nr:hypothetical protein [Bacteroidales bacterium]
LKTTPDSGQSSPYSDMIISCNGVDFVTMGENIINKIPDFYTYENKTITHTEEGLETETRTLTISDMGIAIIRANLSTDEKITEITVFTTRANTDKGIGPGSKLDEFIQAYPDYKIWYNGVSAHFVIESPQCNCLQFQIDKQFYNSDMNKLRSGGKITYLKRNEFAAETVISSVRILKTN